MKRTEQVLTAAALALAAAALAFTWYRLFFGCDLNDEAFSVLVPWRWSLGDRPFIDEMDLAQIAGFLTYPFIKAFTLVAGDTATGLILFTRHLYLLFVTGVAAASVLVLRPLLRWQLAVAVTAVLVTFVFRGVPNLTYNTLAMGLLTLGFMLGLLVITGSKGRRVAALAGLCHGSAVVAFPTLLFVMPFVTMFFVLAQGREARAHVAALGRTVTPIPTAEGRTAKQVFPLLLGYVAGGVVPVAALAGIALIAGPRSLARCWQFTLQAARSLDQLSGAAKAVDVTLGLVQFVASLWPLVTCLAAVLLLFLWRPAVARRLLVLLPAGLYVAGRQEGAGAAGMILAYGLLVPYLYVMLPGHRRRAGAALLIWIWPSALITAAMTAYTSSEGHPHGVVGLYPTVLVSGLFLAWALLDPADEAGGGANERSSGSVAMVWTTFATLAAIVAVTVVFQFQYQVRGTPRDQLTARLDDGPWIGVLATQDQRAFLDEYQADLTSQTRPGDALLVFFRDPGLYLYWPDRLATNSVSLFGRPAGDPFAPLPESTIAYYRRTRRLPDVVVHVCPATTVAPDALEESGGLQYPVALVRQDYAVNGRPAGVSTQEILYGLPRQQ